MSRSDLNLVLSCFFLVLHFSSVSVHSLNGVHSTADAIYTNRQCSRTCESEFCSVPPFLRYGKFCGLLYGGCPGEKPCDGLDTCCMQHDNCIGDMHNDYINQKCTEGLLDCVATLKKSGAQSFNGSRCQINQVIDEISTVMLAALQAAKVLHHKP